MSVDRNLAIRVGSAVVLIAVALLGAWFGGWAGTVLAAALVVAMFVEWIGLTEGGHRGALVFVAPVVAGLALWTAGMEAVGVLTAGAAALASGTARGNLWRALGAVYVAAFGFGLLALRLSPADGLAAVLFVLAIVWASDIAAYFAGRAVGGPRLAPAVSPKKTWSGAVTGFAAGIAAGLAVAALFGAGIGWPLVAVAAGVALAAQAGDLAESLVKRRFGAKDSGDVIPGHGGFMDRLDSLAFAAPAAALIGWAHAPLSPATGLLQW